MSEPKKESDREGSGRAVPGDEDDPMSTAGQEPVSRHSHLDLSELPEVIGRYHVIEKIGEGGMGIVVKAEQRSPVRRIVALKVIKLGLDSKSVLARFQGEQQALAVMDHPNIAKVLDAGIMEGGRAYFVMEYVPGEPITRYCDRQQLNVRQRLELFRFVCSAIQHAHTKGVIHRDLKPDNVLVSVKEGQPAVKVIDFGVAKAIQGRLAEQTYFTEQGQIIGTPEYMSPEQAEMNNLDIDTRSDVYGLGVMLYELVAGCLPFDSKTMRKAAYGEIQRMIREDAPPRPSTRLSSLGGEAAALVAQKRRTQLSQLTNQLHGELGWIPLKALRKDRTERYQTVSALEQDVSNYLQGRPLTAGPESAFYRARKLLLRNKGVACVSMAAVLLLVAGVSLYVIEIRSEQQKTERARQSAEKLAEEKTALADANAALASEKEKLAEAAVKARELSDANAIRATANENLAKINEKRAQRELADSLVAQGDSLALAGAWAEAKDCYQQATDTYQSLGVSPQRADLAMMAAYLHAPPPLCVMTQPTGIAEKDPLVQAYYASQGRDPSQSMGHHESVESLAFSIDGRFALAGVRHAPMTLWDVTTGRIVRMFDSHQGGDRAVALTPDGKWALSGGSLGTLTVWDVNSGKAVKTIALAHIGKITSVAISADATRGLSYGAPRGGAFGKSLIKLWDLSTGKALQSFGSGSSVNFLAMSPDGRRAISASRGHSTSLWDLETGKEIPRPTAQWSGTTSNWHGGASAFSSSGQPLCARELSDVPGVFRLFDDVSGEPIAHFPIATTAPGSFTADGRLAMMESSGSNTLSVFDLSAGRERRALTGHTEGFLTPAMTPDGRFGLTGGWDTTLRSWAIAATPQIIHHESERDIGRKSILSPDGRMVLGAGSASGNRNEYKDPHPPLCGFQIWDAATGKTLLIHDLPTQADGACWSPDGTQIALACWDGLVRVWDLKLGMELPTLGEGGPKLHAVAFSRDGKWLATGGDDGRVLIFDVATSVQRHSLTGLDGAVWDLAFSPDSLSLLGAVDGDGITRDTHLKLWNAETGALIRSFPTRLIDNIAFSPDGASLMVASPTDGMVKIDTRTGARLGGPWQSGNLFGRPGIGFSADGSLIVAGHERGICILAPTEAHPLRILKLPALPKVEYGVGVEFSPDQRYILSGSRLIDISWPARYRELKPGIEQAFKTLRDHPDDGSALKVVGEWYAFNAIWDWSAELLEKAKVNGATISPQMLGQCYWQLNRNDDARREYAAARAATAKPADQLYLQLCLDALQRSPQAATTKP